jgi:hypothetical protein
MSNQTFGARNKPSVESPVKKYIEWSGEKGHFSYYDKNSSKEDKRVVLDMPIYIQPLDSLNTIKGWDDASQSGIYSNEVRLMSDRLTVKSFEGGKLGEGQYEDVKGINGARFTKSVYAVLILNKGKDLELVNFQLKGSALGVYFESDVDRDVVNGNVEYLS